MHCCYELVVADEYQGIGAFCGVEAYFTDAVHMRFRDTIEKLLFIYDKDGLYSICEVKRKISQRIESYTVTFIRYWYKKTAI